MKKYFYTVIILSMWFCFAIEKATACEYCTIPHLGKDTAKTLLESKDKKWFIKYLFEQQAWKEIDLEEAHELHHDGHDIHNKTTENFYHLSMGGELFNNFTMYADVPYIIRNSLQIDEHARLGQKEQSKGWGDLTVIGNYHFLENEERDLSFAGGIKFPIGNTTELNAVGERYEPELQPGSGSYDYILGGVYNITKQRLHILTNLAYVIKTEGDQHYQFGDLLSTSLFIDYLINPNNSKLKSKIGLNANFQYKQRHQDDGVKISDSGGDTLFLGPTLALNTVQNSSVFASFLFPVYQDPNGVHQEIQYTWTAGGKLQF